MRTSRTVEELKLLKVCYGDSDVGLVSLTLREVLVYAEYPDTFIAPKGCPGVFVSDEFMYEHVDSGHNWNDVVDLLVEKYDWETKELKV